MSNYYQTDSFQRIADSLETISRIMAAEAGLKYHAEVHHQGRPCPDGSDDRQCEDAAGFYVMLGEAASEKLAQLTGSDSSDLPWPAVERGANSHAKVGADGSK
jgi:hypothetical protein